MRYGSFFHRNKTLSLTLVPSIVSHFYSAKISTTETGCSLSRSASGDVYFDAHQGTSVFSLRLNGKQSFLLMTVQSGDVAGYPTHRPASTGAISDD